MNNSNPDGGEGQDTGFNNFLEAYTKRVTEAAARYWISMPETERKLFASGNDKQTPLADQCCPKKRKTCKKRPKKCCPMKRKMCKPRCPRPRCLKRMPLCPPPECPPPPCPRRRKPRGCPKRRPKPCCM